MVEDSKSIYHSERYKKIKEAREQVKRQLEERKHRHNRLNVPEDGMPLRSGSDTKDHLVRGGSEINSKPHRRASYGSITEDSNDEHKLLNNKRFSNEGVYSSVTIESLNDLEKDNKMNLYNNQKNNNHSYNINKTNVKNINIMNDFNTKADIDLEGKSNIII